MTSIKLHGILGEQLSKNEWKLSVKSFNEAIHAINIKTKGKLYRQLLDNDKKGIKYEVLINKRKVEFEKPPTIENIDVVQNSELCASFDKIESIDIVPVLEFADEDIASIFTIILGVVLIIVGIIVTGLSFGAAGPLGVALIIGGLGLIAAGVINLLAQPPKFDEFKEISSTNKFSFLFAGPVNTVGEGGPVPIVYGRLIVGSHVISASYEISDISAPTLGYNAGTTAYGGGGGGAGGAGGVGGGVGVPRVLN